ncbi:MAG: hypothetical protein GXP09_03185 [Gammaproteobacteria bacterium]|nr:hypothetical protein [Gammaproteobacteria bacterium]
MKVFTFIAILGAFVASAHAQSPSGLPMGLDYGMPKADVLAHMKAMASYRVQDTKPTTIVYVVPAPDTNTKNGLFLDFAGDRLVEIASMKSEMNKAMYNTYMASLLGQANKWKAAGVETIFEDKSNSMYLYRDHRSYITISGSALSEDRNKFSVTITFTDQKYQDRKK